MRAKETYRQHEEEGEEGRVSEGEHMRWPKRGPRWRREPVATVCNPRNVEVHERKYENSGESRDGGEHGGGWKETSPGHSVACLASRCSAAGLKRFFD